MRDLLCIFVIVKKTNILSPQSFSIIVNFIFNIAIPTSYDVFRKYICIKLVYKMLLFINLAVSRRRPLKLF